MRDLVRGENDGVEAFHPHNQAKFFQTELSTLAVGIENRKDQTDVLVFPVSVDPRRYVDIEDKTSKRINWANLSAGKKICKVRKNGVLVG